MDWCVSVQTVGTLEGWWTGVLECVQTVGTLEGWWTVGDR